MLSDKLGAPVHSSLTTLPRRCSEICGRRNAKTVSPSSAVYSLVLFSYTAIHITTVMLTVNKQGTEDTFKGVIRQRKD